MLFKENLLSYQHSTIRLSQQNEKTNNYRRSVDIIKLENLDTFKKIENHSKLFQVSQGQLKENKLRSELRPTPLTVNSMLPEVKQI